MAEEKTTKSAPKKSAPKKEATKPVAEKTGETAQKAYEATSDAAKVAYEATRDAAMSAFKAATVVVTDPMGGQSKAMKSLGSKGSLAAGIFFVAFFVVIAYLTHMTGGLGTHLKLIGHWLVIAAALFGCFYGLGVFFKRKVTIFETIFSTGVVLFPMAVAYLLTGIDVFTGWIIQAILIYGFSILILLISGFLQDVLKASTQQAVIMAPTILTVVLLVGYIYREIFFDFMGFGLIF